MEIGHIIRLIYVMQITIISMFFGAAAYSSAWVVASILAVAWFFHVMKIIFDKEKEQ